MARRAQTSSRRGEGFTRLGDRLTAKRRAMPWLRIDMDYRFDGLGGLAALTAVTETVSRYALPK